MEKQNTLLTEMYADVRGMRGEQTEFKRETLRRLDSLEKEMKDAPAKKISVACAVVSAAGGILAWLKASMLARS
jgi:hypothetical protein